MHLYDIVNCVGVWNLLNAQIHKLDTLAKLNGAKIICAKFRGAEKLMVLINDFKVVVPYRFLVGHCLNTVIFLISTEFRGVTITRGRVVY